MPLEQKMVGESKLQESHTQETNCREYWYGIDYFSVLVIFVSSFHKVHKMSV
jgi:hypothetical protein